MRTVPVMNSRKDTLWERPCNTAERLKARPNGMIVGRRAPVLSPGRDQHRGEILGPISILPDLERRRRDRRWIPAWGYLADEPHAAPALAPRSGPRAGA